MAGSGQEEDSGKHPVGVLGVEYTGGRIRPTEHGEADAVQVFQSSLAKAMRVPQPLRALRDWHLVLPDQLTDEVGRLAEPPRGELGIVLIESGEWLRRRPYHRQRLGLLLLNQRSFAIEQAARGVSVCYLQTEAPLSGAIQDLLVNGGDRAIAPFGAPVVGPLTVMEPAEREVRAELAPLVDSGALRVLPNSLFMTSTDDFAESARGQRSDRFRMDRFYRHVRQRTGVLMTGDRPLGGRFSFDTENRERWDGTPQAPRPLRFRRSPLRDELEAEIVTRFSRHPGKLDLGALPATRSDVRRVVEWSLRECLPHFGPYEDAMSTASRGLFHTRLSPLMNIGRVLPHTLVARAAAADVPLASREGFIRQILGWREFVRHVHRATDGFRSLAGNGEPTTKPGEGGFRRWKKEAWGACDAPAPIDGGARPNALGADLPLPPAYWGKRSGLGCLDQVVADVWAEGWSHHITRLMVLANIATLLGVSPRELTDWFWVAYADAYDWVVEPNVLAMGTFAVGDLMTTKPYVSGAAYIRSMSDHCATCAFDPNGDCPITSLYWHFLHRNRAALSGNERVAMAVASVARRSNDRRARDERVFVHVRDVLIRGERLTPAGLRSAVDGPQPDGARFRAPAEPAVAGEGEPADSLFP
jgi:deoxyribodipyrimidine photolyase-related protein